MNKMRAIITVGVSASGKSFWAREYVQKHKGTIITNRDDLRFSLTGATSWKDYKFNKETENLITDMQHNIIALAAARGKDIIIADTNLNKEYRDKLMARLDSLGYDIEFKTFPITLEEAWKRDALRANGVGQSVIYKQYQQWLLYSNRKTYVSDELLPKAILVDVDGTLACMECEYCKNKRSRIDK